MLKTIVKVALGCTLAGLVSHAVADDFPNKPIKIVVSFGPGGVADLTARIVAQKMTESLGKQVIVENVPSAGGIVAASRVAGAAPDGYTLLVMSNQNAVSPGLMKSLPYDPAADFSMISSLGFFDLVLVTADTSPHKTVKDLVAAAKADPGRFNIGSIGVGSTQHLSAELFKSLTQLDVPTVTYKGTGDVIIGLKSGGLQLAVETLPAVATQIKAGTLRAIAVTSDKRVASLPNVPTVAESGVAGYQSASWNGLAAPAKTPPEIVARLNREVVKALASPDTKKRLLDIGIEGRSSTPEAFKSLMEKEIVKWRGVIERAKIEKQ
ncbi:MAG: tripartite tricarboxylate transporter substrate binding protein [Pseudomonadota bacterium]